LYFYFKYTIEDIKRIIIFFIKIKLFKK